MSDPLKPIVFSVWWDNFFQEWMACPSDEMAQPVLDALSLEKVTIKQITAETAFDALAQVRPPKDQPKDKISDSNLVDFNDGNHAGKAKKDAVTPNEHQDNVTDVTLSTPARPPTMH